MTAPLLVAAGVSAGYGEAMVLNNVNIEVNAGEVVALVGANGAGKTTTLLTLAGELPLAQGTVRWKGEVTRDKLHRRAKKGLAYVTEERSVFMRLTCEENLRLGRG